jgi:hypothetical protein
LRQSTVNDKFSIYLIIDYTNKTNDLGWVGFESSDIIRKKEREILQNDLTGKYSINDKMTLNLTARYYWSYSDNQAFFTLQDDGALSQNSTYLLNRIEISTHGTLIYLILGGLHRRVNVDLIPQLCSRRQSQ